MSAARTFAILFALASFAAPAFADTSPASPPAAPVASTSAVDTIKNFYATLTDTMKQGDKLGFAGRYKKLDPAIQQAFNLPLMTKFTVGAVWDKATPIEQQQITTAFSSFSVANYASRFTHYDGEQFTVTDEKPISGGELVETTLTPKNKDAVVLNYMMRQDENGKWRIVDVYLGGAVSELATRRSEFAAVIQRAGLAGLASSLDQKSKEMGPS
jgi:phospholipid transport system substrate-binding protein